MNTTAIKVNVSSDIYDTIKEIQQNLKEKEGKKTSLSEILLRLTEKGIKFIKNEQNVKANVQKKNNSVQNMNGFAQKKMQNTQNELENDLILTSEASKNEQLLKIRQEYLNEREFEIRRLEAEIFSEREEILEKKRELLNSEKEIIKKKYKAKYSKIESELISKIDTYMNTSELSSELPTSANINYENEFEKINNALSEIKQNIRNVNIENKQGEIIRYLEQILQNDSRITDLVRTSQEKTPMKTFEMFLPAISTIFVNFLMNKKQKNIDVSELVDKVKSMLEENTNKDK